MLAGFNGEKIALAREIALPARALWERKRVVEDEGLVAEDIHDEGQIVPRHDPHRLGAGGIEQPERRVEWRREQRPRSPFEAVLLFADLDGCAAVAGEHIE